MDLEILVGRILSKIVEGMLKRELTEKEKELVEKMIDEGKSIRKIVDKLKGDL